MRTDRARSHTLYWSLFALVLFLFAAPGCGRFQEADSSAPKDVSIDMRSEKRDGVEVGLPWLEPAISRSEGAALVKDFDWAKTSPLREVDADGSPALYYGVAYLVSRDQREILDQAGLHHSTLPLFQHERDKWNGKKGKIAQSTDGKGAFVFTIIPGRIYNLIRREAIAGDALLPAILLRDVPKGALNAEGSLSYDLLARARFKYRGLEPIHEATGIGTTQQKLVITTARAALKAVADAAEAVPRLVALALGNRDRDGLLFGWGAAGSARLNLVLDVHDTDPAFGGTSMRRAWGSDSGKPVMLPGVRVSIWSRGDATVLDLPTLFEATTDKDSIAVFNIARHRDVRDLCIATENDAAEITDFLTEIEVCNFEHDTDRNIDNLGAGPTNATVTIADTNFNILAQVTEGRAFLQDVVGYSPHKATIVVGWIANAMGAFGTGAPFSPCLGFSNVSADILVVDILGLIAAVPVAGPPLAIALGAVTPLLAADIFFPDGDALDSRGVATHEYGHFATCSMLYDSGVTRLSTAWTSAVADRIMSGAVPPASADEAYAIEAFADFFAGQVVGGTNYFQAGTISSLSISYCDANAPNPNNCLDRNFSNQSDFHAQVARVATTLEDAFDGAFTGAHRLINGNVWTQPSPGAPVVWAGGAYSGDAFDEEVYLPGPAIRSFMGKIDSFQASTFMPALAQTIRENGFDWCKTCRVFSLHAGVAASAPPADHYAACNAAPIVSWVGAGPDPALPASCTFTECAPPLVLTSSADGITCARCPDGQVRVDAQTCGLCPPGTQVVNDQCQTCVNNVCTPACPERQQMVNGVCQDCAFSEVSVNGVCQACPAGQYRYENTCVATCPPPPVGWVLSIVDGVCGYGVL
jgi:hypothetical protein